MPRPAAAAVTEGKDDIRSFIESENRSHAVVVWSKSYCPYCTQTKRLFQQQDVDVVVHELDQHPHGTRIQEELHRLTGQRTVPSVFVRNQHVGGNDDTHRAHRSGELARLLQT